MQIKSYNPSVDPNTIHSNVQAPQATPTPMGPTCLALKCGKLV